MIKNLKTLLLAPLFGVIFSTNASALVAQISNTLTGINGLINVTEQELTGDDFGIGYSLDILSEPSIVEISSFAVSTNSQAGGFFADRDGWAGQQLSAAAWDGGNFSLLGSFSSFFGHDLYVNIFKFSPFGNLSSNPITWINDEIFEFEAFHAVLASDFIALNSQGVIVDQSRRTANEVPEPGPLALLGFGLLGLGLMRKFRTA